VSTGGASIGMDSRGADGVRWGGDEGRGSSCVIRGGSGGQLQAPTSHESWMGSVGSWMGSPGLSMDIYIFFGQLTVAGSKTSKKIPHLQ